MRFINLEFTPTSRGDGDPDGGDDSFAHEASKFGVYAEAGSEEGASGFKEGSWGGC